MNTEAYDAGFEASEEETWDGVAVDSEEPAVHMLLYTFINRKFEEMVMIHQKSKSHAKQTAARVPQAS